MHWLITHHLPHQIAMGYTTFSDAPNISQNRIIGLNPHCILNSHQYSKLWFYMSPIYMFYFVLRVSYLLPWWLWALNIAVSKKKLHPFPCSSQHKRLRGHDKKWYKTNCPCCRRPLEISVTSLKEAGGFEGHRAGIHSSREVAAS